TLEIAGTKFKLVADADAQHLSQLAAMVNERVAKLEHAGKSAPAAQLLALVALGLADDLTTTRKKLNEMEQLTRRTVQGVIARIDKRLSSTHAGAESGAVADAD
ncbi:MAG TPA: cell division protein ZapA, partial [Polyangiales bacterium]|nr:cell division protein ZapA [Polyangiales bacterium]